MTVCLSTTRIERSGWFSPTFNQLQFRRTLCPMVLQPAIIDPSATWKNEDGMHRDWDTRHQSLLGGRKEDCEFDQQILRRIATNRCPACCHFPAAVRNLTLMIEGGLTLIAIAVAFAWPRLGSGWFADLSACRQSYREGRSGPLPRLARCAILLRLAILPIVPIPRRIIPDEFSYWLAADTFSLGRLTNPTPAMWVHFESIHIDMKPTYMSMYFPAQGLVLAAGKLAFGHPWFGQLIVTGLMCSAICWMLQAWLPPGWALLGGLIAVLRLGVFSYWINTYTGAGSIAALGGALVLGALPRLMRHVRIRDGLLLALGVVVAGNQPSLRGSVALSSSSSGARAVDVCWKSSTGFRRINAPSSSAIGSYPRSWIHGWLTTITESTAATLNASLHD